MFWNLVRKIESWFLINPSLTLEVISKMGEYNISPSRIVRNEDDPWTVSFYFFKPLADTYVVWVVAEQDNEILTYTVRNEEIIRQVTSIALNDLEREVSNLSIWLKE